MGVVTEILLEKTRQVSGLRDDFVWCRFDLQAAKNGKTSVSESSRAWLGKRSYRTS